MSSPLNTLVTHAGADNTVYPLNRWGPAQYAVQLLTGTWTVEGTLAQLNRGETAVWGAVSDAGGTPITTIAASGNQILNLAEGPFEAVRLTSVGAGTIRIMQQGFTDWN